ncbi:MAG: cytochrome b/b6 domain-containing protein [Candidatus Thiodiazotropha sp. (ex Lucina aurantia)]|nr:cytochrome b/b6 domain-containing protein [Candidatus Thiodiazotropha sp. (ex Lucina pensylvanica)]MBT3025394.1 cytochrome b/b6 domain-containing protein [Candidatus Thiodiazotropha taylori]MBV2101115.1 cytochrome b/b6 domain-containing protein [Candidatus Thiodiazotropha sp. (ex Codakia orbicularis)]MBV2105236.1 cytochrome b/b6 domain-containing protein [Candidatus Thiodiazotropha sp. (ex Lucina aurantia)]MBV2119680.1 cytochrome b/b6 domain-containing protein [Candidatus Thiodiazotropha sp.
MRRYHPALVLLHWLLAIMIVAGLIMGTNVLSATPNDAPEKLFYLKMHMSMGIIIFILMTVRLGIRFFTAKPPAADIGNRLFNKLGIATHYLFYLVVILMGASGFATANMAGLPEVVFGNSGAPLVSTFDDFPPRIAHGVLSQLLLILIIGHVLAFLYHQYVRKDSLFSRMWFGRHTSTSSEVQS